MAGAQRWTFIGETRASETPEKKKFNKCREAYESMDEKEQKRFIQDLRVYIAGTLSGDELEDFLHPIKYGERGDRC